MQKNGMYGFLSVLETQNIGNSLAENSSQHRNWGSNLMETTPGNWKFSAERRWSIEGGIWLCL